MKTYRVGIVGAGFMGRTHAWCWRSLPFFYSPLDFRVELHGVCTSRPDTARKAMETLGFARTYASVEEMANDPEIDIVDIASPNSAHLEALLAAHHAGKPVYCDKPLTGNLAEAEEMLKAIGDPERAGQMVFHNRFFPATMRARQMVADGALGEIVGFRAAYLHSGNVPEGKPLAWKDMKQFGAGVLYDLGSHVLDLVTWICGDEPVEILARQRTLHPVRPSREDPTRMVAQDTDDQTVMLLTLKSGAVGTIEASKIATGAQDELRFEIEGTRGALRYSLMDPNYLDWFDMARKETPLGGTSGFTRINCVQRFDPPAVFPAPKATIGWLRGHLHCLYSFISALHEGRPFEPSLMRGVQIERWLDAVGRAAGA
jgi:predicted dehydrogenase